MLASVTRLRLRSLRFLLPFMIEAERSRRQAASSPGCLGVQVRKTGGLAFWTLTVWDGEQSLRDFMRRAPHLKAMPKLAGWCDEAATTHWELGPQGTPTWAAASDQLARHGRLSRLSNPSEAHRNGRISTA